MNTKIQAGTLPATHKLIGELTDYTERYADMNGEPREGHCREIIRSAEAWLESGSTTLDPGALVSGLVEYVRRYADVNGEPADGDCRRLLMRAAGISAIGAERISVREEPGQQWSDDQANAPLQETLKVRRRLCDGRFVGKVERVDFTRGGAGNQWTTISGIKYATWWDLRTKDWVVGDIVAFKATNAPMWQGQAAVPQASKIERFGDLGALDNGAAAGLQEADIRVTRRQYDAIIASLRLLEREMEKGAVSPNDGDLGDIMTCSGDHQGLSLEETTLFCDAVLGGQGVTWFEPVSSN